MHKTKKTQDKCIEYDTMCNVLIMYGNVGKPAGLLIMRTAVKRHSFKLMCSILMSQFLTVFSGCSCHLFVTPVNFPPCRLLNISSVIAERKQNRKHT